MLGHLPDVRFLAGVALASIIFDYVYWTFGFFRMGTTGATAQALGRQDLEEVYLLLYRSLTIALILGMIILLLHRPILQASFAMLAGAAGVEAAGKSYFIARIWGAPAVLCNFVFLGWYLGREESKEALYMTLAANGSNIILNYIFLYKLNLAAFGAGLGTMISQYIMLAVALVIFLRKGKAKTWLWSEILSWPKISQMLRFNLDILIRTLCLVSAFALFTNFGAILGTMVLAANSILFRILDIAAYFIDGAAFATESLTGIFIGEQNKHDLKRILRYALVSGEIFAMGFILAILVFPKPIYQGMTSHAEIVSLIQQFNGWLAVTLVFSSIAYIYDGFFLGLTQGRTLRNAMLVSFFLGFLPFALLSVWQKSNHLLWASLLLFMIARASTLGWASRDFMRK